MTTTTVKAVHAIVFADDVLESIGFPTGKPIAPGTVFPCPDDQLAWLKSAGSITGIRAKTAAETAAAVPPPSAEEDDEPGEPSLESLSDADLRAKAKELGVKLTRNMKRDTIISKIELAMDVEGDETDEDDDADNLV